ncbi:SRPBCC domain-containing protein [Nesterenkonia sp. Act20]|uniref:SRPBCC domain-containing protein n=1 Tax=Nesterenkonia sp. Act20 TaxID=1483432 RepID=UPI001C478D78|nr:SRPBCC domain-containing protein [Nesterenkonia sp. Act20]
MTAAPEPTGQLQDGPLGRELQISRRFQQPLQLVWNAMTESEQLEQWIGRWEGDPAAGKVIFRMTAEGEEAPPEECIILDCRPPHSFAAETSVGDNVWHLRFELRQENGITEVVFAQRASDESLGSVGPGWEYYLDRLVSVLTGEDASQVDWDDYYPRLSEYYEQLR